MLEKKHRDDLYTLRWFANKLVTSANSNSATQKLAQEMVLVISKMLGEAVSEKPVVVSPEPETKPNGKHVAIIVGHTKKSPGASSKLLVSEYVYNSDLAENHLVRDFRALGFTVSVHYRDVGGIKAAFAAALKTKPICILELHYNAFNTKATGAEVLFSNHYDKAGLKELELAQILSAQMASTLGIPNRGAKKIASSGERGFQNLSQTTNIAAVLLESGFGDNPSDAKVMKEKKAALSKSIAQGVLKWLAS